MTTTNRIQSIESATLIGERPRHAGYNARLRDHGLQVRVPIVRIQTDDGARGFGFSRATSEQLQPLLNQPIDELIDHTGHVANHARVIEYPLLDWLGHQSGQAVYQIVADKFQKQPQTPFQVPCYDTSLYIDDLHLESNDAAAELIADEARFGFERGHRAFKIKVGRGARHMPLEAGTQRDIAVIKAVRDAVGADCPVMIDANNGYNLNLTKRVLEETADCNIYWLEEPFHEDRILYEDLREWLHQHSLQTLIADGEGQASPSLLDWARDGLIDIVQYDVFGSGFTYWLDIAPQLDSWNVKSAPHHYGCHLGNFVSGHLAAGIENFTMIEWDDVTTRGIDTSAYTLHNGQVEIPDLPGFGITLDDAIFTSAVDENGFRFTH